MRYATPKQVAYIESLARRDYKVFYRELWEINPYVGTDGLEDLSMREASKLIDRLKAETSWDTYGYEDDITPDMYACLDC